MTKGYYIPLKVGRGSSLLASAAKQKMSLDAFAGTLGMFPYKCGHVQVKHLMWHGIFYYEFFTLIKSFLIAFIWPFAVTLDGGKYFLMACMVMPGQWSHVVVKYGSGEVYFFIHSGGCWECWFFVKGQYTLLCDGAGGCSGAYLLQYFCAHAVGFHLPLLWR